MANAIYLNRGTAKVFQASGGDVVFTMDNITTANGRISAVADWGADPIPDAYEVVVTIDATSTPTTGTVARVYWVGRSASTGTAGTDGGFSHTDAAISDEDRLRNCDLIGSVQADEEGSNTFIRTFRYATARRYCQLAFINAFGVSTTNTANISTVTVTPLYYEVQ